MMDVEIKDEIPNLYSLDPEKGIKDAIDCLMQCLECEFEDTPLELAGNQLFIIVVKKNYSFYTFDKGNKLQVYIEDKVFLEKVKYSANIQKEVELNNHILKLQKPALDIQIGFDSKNEIYSINFVLISDGYEKMENIEKEFGDLLNHQKKMNFLENEVVMNNNFIEFFKEIQLLEKVITKLKNKKNYLGVGSCKLFFNKYDYLYLSDKTCTKSHEGSEFLYGKIYIDEQYAIAYDYNLKIKENVKNEDLNFNSNHNFSLNPKPSNMNREETGDTELSEIDDEMTMKIDESPTMKIVKPENSPPNNINSNTYSRNTNNFPPLNLNIKKENNINKSSQITKNETNPQNVNCNINSQNANLKSKDAGYEELNNFNFSFSGKRKNDSMEFQPEDFDFSNQTINKEEVLQLQPGVIDDYEVEEEKEAKKVLPPELFDLYKNHNKLIKNTTIKDVKNIINHRERLNISGLL